MLENKVSDEDVEIILDDVLKLYDYDFRGYSMESLHKRINRLYSLDKFSDFNAFRSALKVRKNYMQHFIREITVTVTEMFRDPLFYRAIREKIFPGLENFPLIRIWHAGCSTGEEVYSMAIMLKEANLLAKSIIYATDINVDVLEKLRIGAFPLSKIEQFARNYLESGGKYDFRSYYHVENAIASFDMDLQRKLVIANHNLVSNKSFNEFHLIFCRNVLIYFNKTLQDNVFALLERSLEKSGFLCLGKRETLNLSPVVSKFQQLDGKEKIWKKID